jgi:hypothetical protein
MKKAFIYVGHSHWGKSFALKHITEGNPFKKTVKIKGIWFWVRKMSNDDKPDELLIAVEGIPESWYDNFILTYCPSHLKDEQAMEILNSLSASCQLFFFVQESRYNNPSEKIEEHEIAYLRTIGVVEILKGRHEDTARANHFRRFITGNL